jgi:hypothetical protein
MKPSRSIFQFKGENRETCATRFGGSRSISYHLGNTNRRKGRWGRRKFHRLRRRWTLQTVKPVHKDFATLLS